MDSGKSFDRRYFETRLNRNIRLATRSRDPQIQAIHREYARMYRQLLEQDELVPA
jgi:hypothetical protein